MGMISHIEDEILELETHELATIKIIVDKELKHREEQKRKVG